MRKRMKRKRFQLNIPWTILNAAWPWRHSWMFITRRSRCISEQIAQIVATFHLDSLSKNLLEENTKPKYATKILKNIWSKHSSNMKYEKYLEIEAKEFHVHYSQLTPMLLRTSLKLSQLFYIVELFCFLRRYEYNAIWFCWTIATPLS